MPKSKPLWMVALLTLVVLASAACVDDKKPGPGTSGNAVPSASSSSSSSESAASGEPTTLDVIAVEAAPGSFVFDTKGVEQVAAGPVDFTFTNSGSTQHEARLIRVLDGNVNAYRTALSGGPSAVASLGQEAAVSGPLQPGGTASQTVELQPGVYVIADFQTAPDGGTFAQQGMLREMAVVPE
jgi:hypothetical protein